MKKNLIAFPLAFLLAGCAGIQHSSTSQSEIAASGGMVQNTKTGDDLITRSLIDSMASPANRFPTNIPR